MKKTLVEGFLAFVKEQYGIAMIAKESDHGESFQDLFGYEFDDVLTGIPDNYHTRGGETI